ncbi:hypothetical protein OG884_09875 [Streptosporangium sp. NBC_01755]|uniref:hypothetical protein n=1 Tax=Streptosporangium sp. NBC_01755 TaxID=2975949 RepID=UPI002DDBD5C3|nr:hypothetical protein [Streptosporangium sp. NBC_01755]WSD02196.1 hypothetical protein OG884_09875 [Streptosporangium sp. NBC_01755]
MSADPRVPPPRSAPAFRPRVPPPRSAPAFRPRVPPPRSAPAFRPRVPPPRSAPAFRPRVPPPRSAPAFRPRTPCLVGVARHTVRDRPGPEPLDLWELAGRPCTRRTVAVMKVGLAGEAREPVGTEVRLVTEGPVNVATW